MLGKVFEELVTGRHETGSYYTPRPIVSFMCREALKGYLKTRVSGLSDDAVARYVDQHDVSAITREAAVRILDALETITIVDPACGSGAYLLGMMQELLELENLLYNPSLIARAEDTYKSKLRIIEKNVYGVDIDQFAVNTAMLRLWLSLIVDYEGEGDPLPLPNLDFKISCGDSLVGPNPQEIISDMFRAKCNEMAGELARGLCRRLRARWV
jgi:SAM-dependent methyltransferase